MAQANTNEEGSILNQVVATIRASSAVSAQDVSFYKNLDPSIATSVDNISTRLLGLINDILLSVDENNDTIELGHEGLESAWSNVGEVMDLLFEKSEHALAANIKRDNREKAKAVQYLDDSPSLHDGAPKKISKPQLYFHRPIDNSESHPFKPLLEKKPHALRSLDESLRLTTEEEDIPAHFPQPYGYEIDHQEYSESVLQISDPIPSLPWDETEAEWVDNTNALKLMFDELLLAKEIAIDLEHHDYRTYYGITCLMQISTRGKDWLIDTIALRDDLWILNEVFTDPKITKVLHGAFMDIIWLQRDLGLYIVSLFDTYHASRLLGFPKHSLAYLLERYAHFKTSKKYQLSDWRVRPLPKALRAYARADTHFLLNIYDNMRNSLIEQNKLSQVLHDSRNVAKRRFEFTTFRPKINTSLVFSPTEREDPWRTLMFQYNIPQSKSLLVRRLYEWRDVMARKDDESPRYVIPNQLMVSLAMSAPTTPASILTTSTFVTEHIRQNAKSLAQLIKKSLASSGEEFGELFNSANVAQSRGFRKISQEDIEKNAKMFARFLENLSDEKAADCDVSSRSSLFQGKFVPCEEYVSYQQSRASLVDHGSLENRRQLLLKKYEADRANVRSQFHVKAAASGSVSNEETGGENIKSLEGEDNTPREDMDEIIVLKQRKALVSKEQSVADNEVPIVEPLDFQSAKRILEAPSGNVRKPKKRFDPYAPLVDGPPSVKKRRRTKGMQKSFRG
ncbi:LAQU0S03e09252g1_1 [Lachancea quebecensis]|uniref:LAQU0S03e09252g1_1 n=1 Tax=Lachancea quebecensis TaxID=1654605 RepID=A0A0P1KS59_9SACH|nr:LAQU0S03e09252g1_1 [Lachancea quebecensis]